MKNGNKNNFDIFISYRHDEGFGIARAVYAELAFRGYRVFMDTEHLSSGRFDEQLLKQIAKAKDVIFVLTKGALDIREGKDPSKDWFRREIEFALNSAKRPNILPIKDESFDWPADGVLRADGLEGGINIVEFKNYEAEPFIPKLFSNLIDRLTGKDSLFHLRARPIEKYWHRCCFAVLTFVFIIGLLWGGANHIRPLGKIFKVRHDPVILVGSGTVSNYLRGIGVLESDRDVFIFDSPSNFALKSLREAKNSERRNCHIMLLSARKASTEYFEQNDLDMSNLRLVEVNLNTNDNLQVILKPWETFSPYLSVEDRQINITNLIQILKDFGPRDDTFVYRTSLESGTFAMFTSAFKSSGYALECKNICEFYEADKGEMLKMHDEHSKSIVLCGNMYKPAVESYGYKGMEGKLLDVVNENGDKIAKDLYMYFVVAKDNPEIPLAIRMFLHNMHKDNVLYNLNPKCLDKTIYRDDGSIDSL